MSLNSSGLTPTAARRLLLAVAAFETLVALFDLAVLGPVFGPDLNTLPTPLNFIHAFFAIAALVLAAHWYLHAAIVVLAANILATLAVGLSPDLMLGLSLLAQRVIFGPLAVTAIVLAVLDKFLWLGVVFVALPSATLLLELGPLILFAIVFAIATIISGGGR